MIEGPALADRDASTRAPRSWALLAWALLVIPLWGALVLCTRWEPVMRDGWGHFNWHRLNAITPFVLYDFCREIYLHENPRLGQFLTLLLYARGPYHAIVTPVVELGVFALATVLALGRWPSLRRSEDAFAALVVTALIAVCAPQIGALLFYRPFTGNYTFGLALNLLWLVPFRLEVTQPRARRRWLAPVMLASGLLAGLCNEHTGVAFLGLGLLATFVVARRRGLQLWMVAGLAGMLAGYALLLTAPGQQLRYGGLAAQAGMLERIVARGALGNLRIVGVLTLALLPVLPLVGLLVLERRVAGAARWAPTQRWASIVLALAGLACTLTLLGSPKVGPRLYFASIALIAAGLTGWATAQLYRRWARRATGLVAAAALIYVLGRMVLIHQQVGPVGALRLDRIQHAAPGSVVTVPRYPVEGSRYFLGEDFVAPNLRAAVAGDHGLAAVELAPAAPR